MNDDLCQPLVLRPFQNRVVQRTFKQFGQYGNYIYTHDGLIFSCAKLEHWCEFHKPPECKFSSKRHRRTTKKDNGYVRHPFIATNLQ